MSGLALVGDIGGTNSRFGLAEPGSTRVAEIAVLKNDRFGSLEEAISAYLTSKGVTELAAAAIAVAGPVEGETVSLTNRDWRFTRQSLRAAAQAREIRLLNDFEALAWSLPHLGESDLVQVGGMAPDRPALKIVLGPGTGLGMAALAPLPGGGWLPLACEGGHVTLPVLTRAEFDWREKMSRPGVPFEAEDAITGGGLLHMYQAISATPTLETPEAVLQAALAGTDEAAVRTLDQFVIWLARVASDAAMALQAKGGVYLAGGIVPSILEKLQDGRFREVFELRGKIGYVMKPIPVYAMVGEFPALRGCAAAIAGIRS